MIVNNSYFIKNDDLSTIEVGSLVFSPEEEAWYIVLAPGELTRIDAEAIDINTLEELTTIMNNVSGEANLTLNKDMTLETYVVIAGNGSVNMDLNGHNIIRDQATALYMNSDDVEVNIKGQGEVAGAQAIWANAGTANIYEGTFRSNAVKGGDCIYASGTGKVNIYGGEFFAEVNNEDFAEPHYSCLNIRDAYRGTASITVYGGTFHNFNPADNVSEGRGTNFVAPGYKSVEESKGVFVVMPE